MHFKRAIGPVGFLFCILGAVIGSGWLLGPFFTAKVAGPAGVLSWIIGGIMMAFIIIPYAELGSMLPLAGGPTRYLQLSHGTVASFTVGWITFLATVAVAPIETLAMLHYASSYLPSLMHEVRGVALLTFSGYLVACVILFFMTLMNLYGVKFFSSSNNWIMLFKLTVPCLTIIVLFSTCFHPTNFASHGFLVMGWEGVLTALPSAGVIFSLMGCHAALQYVAEVKKPQYTIPFGIVGGLLISVILYVLLQFAFTGSLNPIDFSNGWSALEYKDDIGPFVGLASAVGAVWLTKILYFDAVLSPYGCGLVYTGAAARLCYALSKNGYFPKKLMVLNRFGVPARILVINYLLGLVLFLPFPTWQSMMSFLVSSLIIGYGVGPLSLVVLRNSMKNYQRPFKVPAIQFIGFFGFYFCNLIVIWTSWAVISKMMIAIVLGYFVLAWYRYGPPKEKLHLNLANGWWIIPYLLGLAVISYCSTFGGISLLPFGWDFFVTAVLSVVIYIYAQKSGIEAKDLQNMIKIEKLEFE